MGKMCRKFPSVFASPAWAQQQCYQKVPDHLSTRPLSVMTVRLTSRLHGMQMMPPCWDRIIYFLMYSLSLACNQACGRLRPCGMITIALSCCEPPQILLQAKAAQVCRENVAQDDAQLCGISLARCAVSCSTTVQPQFILLTAYSVCITW